jgi:hypothetical protein
MQRPAGRPFPPIVFKKNINIWMHAYVRQCIRSNFTVKGPVHIIFALVDHYEPYWNKASDGKALDRVRAWHEKLPAISCRFKDSGGAHPRHTFFYPEEEYTYECLSILEDICGQGIGDVEIHLHHDNDTEEGLRQKLVRFKSLLNEKHGFLHKDSSGEILYGFIHGNWALDNSRKDGRLCGVNNELTVLKETGCYADFTMPSAPSETQTEKTNSIYYAKDDPEAPKSHDTGTDAEVGVAATDDLLLVQGPLTLNWGNRKMGFLPKIENSDLSACNPPTHDRVDLWIKQHIHVKGRPEWIFVKVHTHGTQESNMNMLFNGGLEKMYAYLEDKYNDGENYMLHYVSAWEMYNIIKAAEAGETGNPSKFYEYL